MVSNVTSLGSVGNIVLVVTVSPMWLECCVAKTKESCSAAPPAGEQRADRHTAGQAEGEELEDEDEAVDVLYLRDSRACGTEFNLFKAFCVYIWSVICLDVYMKMNLF